ncbi:flagellar hook-associated protein FlgL [Salimicrobium flavidum]|uniref:Flagellar hook-associated protein 3 FlgL n=1 Tax=Salimicrobium flavidum TaxID=570947 RepID=A0A1N7J0Y5_9BACI|nr:flagellar hook-associated protein FlgL [Salimicrobium flavidum]SIS42980.1 flagellar hook-associated protein 3 FlgL [Salimicrobium flavidum]
MRVTQGMLTNNMLRNMSKSYESMGKYQEQFSTGKKISRPSDDPVVAMKGIDYRSELTKVEQFERNIGEVYNWMDSSDAALDESTKALQRVRELTVQGSSDTLGDQERESIAKEVRQISDHLKDLANTEVNGKYLFNGTDTTNAPASTGGDGEVTFDADESSVNIEISKGVTVKSNVNGNNVFGDIDVETEEDGTVQKNVFETLGDLADTLEGKEIDQPRELDSFLSEVDGHVNKVIDERADLGARMNRRDMVEDRLAVQKEITTKMMSDNEDAEMEEVITNLKTQESIHRAALSAGARIIQPTLMDFLR